ncbi:hypothetical protein MLD38_009477 [Melastoma candidum]|uniref:Uncharacterized protein n=1 Tax=Melastoma candidum TaxID=119954 RepID=A0ACB9RXB9_9MYRT|nr:hypothetical protein MLD38_009477 [Melastoma candidum]
MVSAARTIVSGFNFSEQWIVTAVSVLLGGIFGYIVYGAVMATASELLQRLLVISPLLIIILVHWLSSDDQLSIPIRGSEPGAIHRAGGSAWGVALVLMLLIALITFQPVLNGLIS